MKSRRNFDRKAREQHKAYITRHESAEGDRDTLYAQAKSAKYRSDIRASKRRRTSRLAEINARRSDERRKKGHNALRKVGAMATVAVIALAIGKGLDGTAKDLERRDNQALNVYKQQTGIDPLKAVSVETDQISDAQPQTPEATVTSTVYANPEEAQEAVENIENNNITGGIGVVTAPVEPSDANPTGGIEVIQIKQNN